MLRINNLEVICKAGLLTICLLAVTIAGCDLLDTTSNLSNSKPLFNILSVESIPENGKWAQKLLVYVRTHDKVSVDDINWNDIHVMRMKVKDNSEVVNVVLANIGTTPGHLQVPSRSETMGPYTIDDSKIMFLPAKNKLIRSDRYFSDSSKQNGFAQYTFMASSEYLTYEVTNGLPTEEVAMGDFSEKKIDGLIAYEDICLNCGTAECYQAATSACAGEADCNLLCDALDAVGGWCSGSILVACFIYNNT